MSWYFITDYSHKDINQTGQEPPRSGAGVSPSNAGARARCRPHGWLHGSHAQLSTLSHSAATQTASDFVTRFCSCIVARVIFYDGVDLR